MEALAAAAIGDMIEVAKIDGPERIRPTDAEASVTEQRRALAEGRAALFAHDAVMAEARLHHRRRDPRVSSRSTDTAYGSDSGCKHDSHRPRPPIRRSLNTMPAARTAKVTASAISIGQRPLAPSASAARYAQPPASAAVT